MWPRDSWACRPQVVESGILDKLPAEERKRQEVRGLGKERGPQYMWEDDARRRHLPCTLAPPGLVRMPPDAFGQVVPGVAAITPSQTK